MLNKGTLSNFSREASENIYYPEDSHLTTVWCLLTDSADFFYQLAKNKSISEGCATLTEFRMHKIRMPLYYS